MSELPSRKWEVYSSRSLELSLRRMPATMELVHADDAYTSMVAAEPTELPLFIGEHSTWDMLPDSVGVGGPSELDPAATDPFVLFQAYLEQARRQLPPPA